MEDPLTKLNNELKMLDSQLKLKVEPELNLTTKSRVLPSQLLSNVQQKQISTFDLEYQLDELKVVKEQNQLLQHELQQKQALTEEVQKLRIQLTTQIAKIQQKEALLNQKYQEKVEQKLAQLDLEKVTFIQDVLTQLQPHFKSQLEQDSYIETIATELRVYQQKEEKIKQFNSELIEKLEQFKQEIVKQRQINTELQTEIIASNDQKIKLQQEINESQIQINDLRSQLEQSEKSALFKNNQSVSTSHQLEEHVQQLQTELAQQKSVNDQLLQAVKQNQSLQPLNQQQIQIIPESTQYFIDYLIYALNLAYQQIIALQFDKNLLKQLNANAQQDQDAVRHFINKPNRTTTNQKLRRIKIAIIFFIRLKRIPTGQRTRSFNQKLIVPQTRTLKKFNYQIPKTYLQFESYLDQYTHSQLTAQSNATQIRFKTNTSHQELNNLFFALKNSNTEQEKTLKTLSITNNNQQQELNIHKNALIEANTKLKLFQNSVPMDKFQQIVNENDILNHNLIEIIQKMEKFDEENRFLHGENQRLTLVNDQNIKFAEELVGQRKKYGDLVGQYNALKRDFDQQMNRLGLTLQSSFQNEKPEQHTEKDKSKNQVLQEQNISNYINTRDTQSLKRQQQDEVDLLQSLRTKYMNSSIYGYQNQSKYATTIHSLNANVEYSNDPLGYGQRIHELLDFK
ncbi:Hypothetical_protein [Hexamita inflata]|uniref:Hypothetical_protein n=1 Tax=Hexamita inflata TaxID=28002 RepID=A0AA86R3U1_9EUKA|nr:Hypothetical protein HINF_LOCUS58834 [Hexamita inflata]